MNIDIIEFLGGWCVWGVIQFGFGLLCAASGDYGPENKYAQVFWFIVGGPVVWVLEGIGYLAIINEERNIKRLERIQQMIKQEQKGNSI